MDSSQPQSLWNEILAEASTSRSAPQKTVLLLGDPRSGKDAVAASLRGSEATSSPWTGLGYQYFNVKDPQDQETLARCSIYSCSRPTQDFLQLPLRPATLSSTLALLCLDFSKPEHAIDSLLTWLGALQTLTKAWSNKQTTDFAYDLQNAQDRLRQLWSAYQEPTVKSDGTLQPPLPGSSHASEDLQQGTLQDNLGLQLVIVCTKTDLLDALEKDRRYTEETFDFIQQVLRTVCLRYGAALIFTSTHRPATLSTLKEYTLHQLFNSSEDSSASSLRTFPFLHRANVVDRDALLVPAGWDSWGKIKVLRDSFDAQATSNAWQALLDQKLGQAPPDEEDVQAASSLLAQWSTTVGEASDPTPVSKNLTTRVTDEQDFLRSHFDLIAKDKDKLQSQSPRPSASLPHTTSELGASGPGRVGPMASSALHLPSVEKALAMSSGGSGSAPDTSSTDNSNVTSSHTRKDSARLGEATEKFTRLSSRKDSNGAPNNPRSPLLSTPAGASANASQAGGTSGTPGTQNEVLANFFQSLLSARKDPNARSAGGAGGASGNLGGRGSPSLQQQQYQSNQQADGQ